MSFLLSFFSLFTILNAQVEWIYDQLKVPLYSDIEEFKYLPKAELFINGVSIYDPQMYYERDAVDHTFFSVISTSYLKTYTMRYRVVFPTYQVSNVHDIIFDIVDVTSPEILAIKTFKIPLGQNSVDFYSGLIISDNYDTNDQLITSIISIEVIWNQVGIYDIYYQVSDTSGNYINQTTTLEIYDYLAPEIIQKELLIIPYGSLFLWRDFFDVEDNDDPFPSVVMNDFSVDYTHLGLYDISLTATDQNGLSTTKFYKLSIVDNEPPIIITRSNPLPISVGSFSDSINFNDYILSLSDNYDELNLDDLSVMNDIEFDMIGTYEITYCIEDSSGNSATKKMNIDVVDNQKPTIELLSPLVFDVFDEEPFYIQLIDFHDNYTDHDSLSIKITESVKMNQIGNYAIAIEVSDQAKNISMYYGYVSIVDRIPPEMNQINDILITDFKQKDLNNYFETSDNYDSPTDITLIIDDQYVIYNQIGSYPLYIDVYDQSLNHFQFISEVHVIDIIEPILSLKQTVLNAEIFSEPIELSFFILEIDDNYDDLSIEDVMITDDINYDQLGIYLVTYCLLDSSMNKVLEYMYVIIDDLTPPRVELPPITLGINAYFNPLQGVITNDNLDEVEIHTFPKELDTSVPGIKEITYVISDLRGNYTIGIRKIIVEEVSQEISIKEYIPIVLVTILGGGVCYYIYKKMT